MRYEYFIIANCKNMKNVMSNNEQTKLNLMILLDFIGSIKFY